MTRWCQLGRCLSHSVGVLPREGAPRAHEDRQVRPGVPGQCQQTQRMVADLQRTGNQHLVWQYHFGATHPVTDQPVHVLGHGIALLAQQIRGPRQRADGDVAEGLVAQDMVGVMMGQQHLDYRLIGDRGNRLAQGLPVAPGRAAVDDHHAGLGDNKSGVDDVAAVGLGKIVRAAFQQPGAFGDLPGLE